MLSIKYNSKSYKLLKELGYSDLNTLTCTYECVIVSRTSKLLGGYRNQKSETTITQLILKGILS